MSFENFPEIDKSQQLSPPSKNNTKRNLLTGGLLLALLGTWGYMLYDKNVTKETIQQKDTVLAATSTEKDELRKELDDATMRFDMIKTSSANMEHSKDSTISQRDRDIADKKTKIQQLLGKADATKAELAQAKSLIASLNDDISGYKSQIETLKGEKVLLTKQKDSVTEQRNVVTKERDQARQETQQAKTVIKEKENVIDIGSTLHASNFDIIGINEKRNGKEKTTSTAKKVDVLRISFDLDENRITQSGTKPIYICISDPNGTPVTVEALGSGSFKTRDNQDKLYTQKIDVNYTQGQRQTISVDWKQNSKFLIGDYKIEVYHNGFKIGDGIRTFKKGGLFG